MDARICVLGSGPASVACAAALIEHGYTVTMLDAGNNLEPARAQVVAQMARQPRRDWDDAAVHMLKQGAGATARGIPVKKIYGSDFPYRDVAKHLPMRADHVAPFASLAVGGLSNVWGAAVLPYRPEDIADWPIPAAVLAPYYQAVFRFLPLAAREDDLQEFFPFHTASFQHFQPSQQATHILTRMARHRDRLRGRGIACGQSRLAVRVAATNGAFGCAYCGMCMYGCPYDLIYKSTHTLRALLATGRLHYSADAVVDELHEDAGVVQVYGHDRQSGARRQMEADRVFVGCGVLATASIMLRSLRAYDTPITMRDSQYFLLPLLALDGCAGVAREPLHTLAQVFIEMRDPAVSAFPVHFQLYTYNDLYADALRSMLRPAYGALKLPLSALLSRMLIIQGFLHSHESSSAAITLSADTLHLRREPRPAVARTVRRAVRALQRNATALGFLPITPALKIGDPGQGVHFGGTFPMREHPGPRESDIMGRPFSFSRVHIVDASVLPTIPATTITLNAMANAYRIGSEWQRYV